MPPLRGSGGSFADYRGLTPTAKTHVGAMRLTRIPSCPEACRLGSGRNKSYGLPTLHRADCFTKRRSQVAFAAARRLRKSLPQGRKVPRDVILRVRLTVWFDSEADVPRERSRVCFSIDGAQISPLACRGGFARDRQQSEVFNGVGKAVRRRRRDQPEGRQWL